jgi:hypothetical protein
MTSAAPHIGIEAHEHGSELNPAVTRVLNYAMWVGVVAAVGIVGFWAYDYLKAASAGRQTSEAQLAADEDAPGG